MLMPIIRRFRLALLRASMTADSASKFFLAAERAKVVKNTKVLVEFDRL